jgi:hypothetical protein
LLLEQWELEQLPQTTITPADRPDSEPTWAVLLEGHTLPGNVPAARRRRRPAKRPRPEPPTTAEPPATSHAEQQSTTLLSFVLSPLRVRSAVTADPGRAMSDGQYVQLLCLRLGVPRVMPPAQRRCNCASHDGPRHSAYVERAAEGNQGDHLQQAASFANDERVMGRHDNIRDSLAVGLFKAVQAGRRLRQQIGADVRQGDVQVHEGGDTTCGSWTWASCAPLPSAMSAA